MIKAIPLLTLLICAAAAVSGLGVGGRTRHHRSPDTANDVHHDERRRALVLGTIPLAFWSINPPPSPAAKLRPDDAYASLVKARQELQTAGDYLPKKDWSGLRSFLDDDAVNMNNYESNAQALLESKRLDAESKKDIGTIRRYGVGADVIIMYGGLKAEVNEENADTVSYAGVDKYLKRTMESLDEVLAICRSNGFN